MKIKSICLCVCVFPVNKQTKINQNRVRSHLGKRKSSKNEEKSSFSIFVSSLSLFLSSSTSKNDHAAKYRGKKPCCFLFPSHIQWERKRIGNTNIYYALRIFFSSQSVSLSLLSVLCREWRTENFSLYTQKHFLCFAPPLSVAIIVWLPLFDRWNAKKKSVLRERASLKKTVV